MAGIGDIAKSLMPVRKDWNRKGPPVPRWFRAKLKRIDPRLVLQYMPPCDPRDVGKGVDNRIYPNGVWAVCRRLPRTGYLLKQWVYCITDPQTKEHRPNVAVLRAIKYCRDLAKWSKSRGIADEIDRAVYKVLTSPSTGRQRQRWCERVAHTCRQFNITNASLGKVAVQVPGAKA